MDWSLAIAGLSLAVSSWVAVRQWRSAEQAHFTVAWRDSGMLVVVNQGPGAAKKVSASASVGARSPRKESTAKADLLPARQPLSLGVPASLGEEPPVVTVAWKDRRFRPQTWTIETPPRPAPLPAPRSSRSAPLEEGVRRVARAEAEAVIAEERRYRDAMGRYGR